MSLILELQQECLSQGDVMSLLRKAHLVAFKLSLDEFDAWITAEMNGYSDDAEIPVYRMVMGTLKARAPEYARGVVINLSKQPMEAPLKMSLSTIERASKDSGDESCFAPSIEAAEYIVQRNPGLKGSSFFLTVPKAELEKILDGVKNHILQWALELERMGVAGERLSFTEVEKEAAKAIPIQQILIQVQGDMNGSLQIQQGTQDSRQAGDVLL